MIRLIELLTTPLEMYGVLFKTLKYYRLNTLKYFEIHKVMVIRNPTF